MLILEPLVGRDEFVFRAEEMLGLGHSLQCKAEKGAPCLPCALNVLRMGWNGVTQEQAANALEFHERLQTRPGDVFAALLEGWSAEQVTRYLERTEKIPTLTKRQLEVLKEMAKGTELVLEISEKPNYYLGQKRVMFKTVGPLLRHCLIDVETAGPRTVYRLMSLGRQYAAGHILINHRPKMKTV